MHSCCVGVIVWVFNPFSILDLISKPKGCPLPPKEFSEKDLIGTWVARRLDETDTLIIRDDGKYKQIIRVENSLAEYESGWQIWWLDYSGVGTPNLHLEGMRLCLALLEDDCSQAGWGKLQWHDVCKDTWVKLPDKVILSILGVEKRFIQPPRGINLILFTGLDGISWGYELQEP